jgi:hypothetical protein
MNDMSAAELKLYNSLDHDEWKPDPYDEPMLDEREYFSAVHKQSGMYINILDDAWNLTAGASVTFETKYKTNGPVLKRFTEGWSKVKSPDELTTVQLLHYIKIKQIHDQIKDKLGENHD